jgi:hypothetical protein
MPLWKHFAIGLICESGVEAAQAAIHPQMMSSYRIDQIDYLDGLTPSILLYSNSRRVDSQTACVYAKHPLASNGRHVGNSHSLVVFPSNSRRIWSTALIVFGAYLNGCHRFVCAYMAFTGVCLIPLWVLARGVLLWS